MRPRVIIIGGGIMGLSSAWALNRAGCEVTLYEQSTLPNEFGSSVDQHRLIRYPYGAEDGYTQMVQHAFGAWQALWEDLEQSFYHETGTLVGVDEGQTWALDSRRTLERLNISFERLGPTELQTRWPHIRMEGFEEAFYLPSGGALFTRPLIASLTRYLWNIGVDLHQKSQVIDMDLERATVHLGNGYTDQADALIIAAGPWVTKLLPKTNQLVTPSRQVVYYVKPPAKLQQAWSETPMLLDIGKKGGIYLVPPIAGSTMKVGDHSFSMTGDPDHQRLEKPNERQQIEELCSKRIRDFHSYRTGEARVCFYTVQSQERFILKREGRSLLMTGFSGHGFKFGALMGHAARAALLAPETAADITKWAAGASMEMPFELPVSAV